MAENPFRVLLDFRELNFKFYKFVWMSVSPRELVTIRDLKDSILKKFAFEQTDLHLFLRDGFLPEDENISNILRENDNIRLFYSEPSNSNQSYSRTVNYETIEQSSNDVQVKSSEKRKAQLDVSEGTSEQANSIKKRKHSFSNGTYVFQNNNTPGNSLSSDFPDNLETITGTDLYSHEGKKNQDSSKVRKKLKYTIDASVPQNITLYHDSLPTFEKNEIRVNSCKKKKKHKHSKDVSENEIFLVDNAARSEINKSEPHKKKKRHDHSRNASKSDSASELTVSFYGETANTTENLNNSVNDLETKNELSELKESVFETVTDNSEVLKVISNSLSTSSINTSSGIGSLKASEENKISSEQNCDESVREVEENNLSISQGNNCKKKKRKRHRKRKSLLINPQVDETNDSNSDMLSPWKDESLNSSCTSGSYQISEMSPKIKETSDNSKSNAFLSTRNTNSPETKKGFLKPFSSSMPCTSTPFLQTPVLSSMFPRNNVIFKMPYSSSSSQNQSSSVTSSQKTVLPTNQKNMNGNSSFTPSSPNSLAKNKKATGSDLNLYEKSSFPKMNNQSDKSAVSVPNIGIKSRFLDPNFSYEGCPPLNSCPLVGTRIAYKILELDSSYSPVVSNYKEGIVKAVNSQTDELEIELIEPEVKEGRTGKFENLYEDEEPSCEVIRKVTLNWPSLIDPVRVIY